MGIPVGSGPADGASPPALGLVAQQVVGEHAGDHGLADGDGADADARVMAALGGDLHLLAVGVDGLLGNGDGTGGLDDEAGDDVLAG